MKVYGILEGIVENTNRVCNPAIRDFRVCETGFRTEEDACQSLIDIGWRNHAESFIKWFLGQDSWINDDPAEVDEDDQPILRVRYVFEIEVDG